MDSSFYIICPPTPSIPPTYPNAISYTQPLPIIRNANLSPYIPNSLPASPDHDNAAFPGFNQQPLVGQDSFWRASPSYHTLSPFISSPRLQIHPYLNGESTHGHLVFDLSLPTFSPMLRVGPGHAAILSEEVLNQPATHPPITRLELICDRIPQWPINLGHNTLSPGSLPPIRVGDILWGVWQNLHAKIWQSDWDKLNMAEGTEVARAYTTRYRNATSREMMVDAKGMGKVDFLLEKVWFKGLVSIGESYEQMLLVVA